MLVGRQGIVRGDIETREAVIGGTVEGTIVGAERVEVQATAAIQGDINTRTIVIAEGGKINGSVRMEEGRSAARPHTSGEPALVVAK